VNSEQNGKGCFGLNSSLFTASEEEYNSEWPFPFYGNRLRINPMMPDDRESLKERIIPFESRVNCT
jgi:hypothetical protein